MAEDSSDAMATTPRRQFLSLIDPDQRSPHGTPGVTPRELAIAGLKNQAAGGRSGRSGAVTPTGGASSSATTFANLKAAAMAAKARGAALSPRPGVSPSGRSTPGAGVSPRGGGHQGTKARAALALEADTSTGPPGGGSDHLLAPAQPVQAQQQPGAEQSSSVSTPTRGVTPNGGRMISPFAAVQPEQQEVHLAARPASAPPQSTFGGSSGMPAAPWLLQGGSKAAAHAQYHGTAGGPGLHVLGGPPGALQQQRQVLHPAELSAADGNTGPRKSDDNGGAAGASSGGAAGGSGLASFNPAVRLCSSASSSPHHLAFARLGSMATVGSLAPFADMQQQQRTISVADSFACPGMSVDFFMPLGAPAAGGHTSSSGSSSGASLLSRGRGPGGAYRAGSLAEGAMRTSSLSPALKRRGSMAPASTEITEEGSEGAEAPGGGGEEASAAALPPQQRQVLGTSASPAPCRTADVLEEEEAAGEAAAPETGPTEEGAAPDVATSKLEAVAVAVRTAATAVAAVLVPAAVKRAVATKNGRRVCVVGAVLILGGLWALSATLGTASMAGAGAAAAAAGTATATESAAPAATTGAVVDAAVKAALGVAATTAQAAGAASAAAAAAVAVGMHAARMAAWPAQGPIVSLSTPAVTSHLYSQGASAVTVGRVDAALLQQQGAAQVTAEGCAAVAGLPVAQMLCA